MAPAPARWRAWAPALVLATATAVLYYPVHRHPFVNYDDSLYVTNKHVQMPIGWETVRWAFTTFENGNWHPLTWLSHALDWELFQSNPAGHHDVNLALHAINVVLLYWLLLQATGSRGRSFMVAGLVALHPINVESVAWVAQRQNLLSMWFFLFALAAYQWYARQPRIQRYFAVSLLFALALLAKPQVITFPLVLLLWDYWPLRRMSASTEKRDSGFAMESVFPARRLSALVMEKLPLLALSAASGFLTMKAPKGILTMKAQSAGAGALLYPRSVRLENAVVSYVQYLRHAVWPAGLAAFYPHPGYSLRFRTAVAALLLLLAVTALVWRQRRKRYLVTGWLWFLGTMAPMIGLEGVGYQGMQGMADRYAYLPFVGLFIMLCWSIGDWATKQRISSAWLGALAFAVLSFLMVVSRSQLAYWSDSTILWSHTLQVTHDNWLAENNLGSILMRRGQAGEGVRHFRKAVEIYPGDPVSNMNLGIYEQYRGNPKAAIEYFKIALATPDSALRSAVWNNMGRAYRELGDDARAAECFIAAQTQELDARH